MMTSESTLETQNKTKEQDLTGEGKQNEIGEDEEEDEDGEAG